MVKDGKDVCDICERELSPQLTPEEREERRRKHGGVPYVETCAKCVIPGLPTFSNARAPR